MVNEQSDNQKKRERIVIETGSSMIDRAHIDNAIEYPPEITESLNQNDDNTIEPPITIESLEHAIDQSYDIYRLTCCDNFELEIMYGEIKSAIAVMASILRNHGVFLQRPQKAGYEPRSDYQHFPDDNESLCQRYFATRESLRKSGDQLVLRKEIKKIKSNKPCEMQEEVITKKEAIEWLQGTGATDAEIFGITGERPEAAGEGLLRSTISENNTCKGNRIFVAR